MAIKVTGVTQTTLTAEALDDFMRALPLLGERELKQSRLAKLLKLIRDGDFIDVKWARGHCLADGNTYRFDGQHTTHLLDDLRTNPRPDVAFPIGTPIAITEYEFTSIDEDCPQIFDLFNNPLSVRSNTDAMGIYRAGFTELRDTAPAFLVRVTNGIVYHYKLQPKTDEDDKMPLFRVEPRRAGTLFAHAPHRAFALWVWTLRDTRNTRFMGRTGIMARLFADWLDNASVAELFWRQVLEESHPNRDDETRVFAEDLKRLDNSGRKVTQDKLYREGAKAWRRFRRELRAA